MKRIVTIFRSFYTKVFRRLLSDFLIIAMPKFVTGKIHYRINMAVQSDLCTIFLSNLIWIEYKLNFSILSLFENSIRSFENSIRLFDNLSYRCFCICFGVCKMLFYNVCLSSDKTEMNNHTAAIKRYLRECNRMHIHIFLTNFTKETSYHYFKFGVYHNPGIK
jgi:hypothetical protein